MSTPQAVAERIGKLARKYDTEVQEAIVTDIGNVSGGLIQALLNSNPIHVRANGIETLTVSDAILVKRMTGEPWSRWHYAGFSHRGDVTSDDLLYWEPRVQSTLQLISTCTSGTIVRMGVDYPSQVVRWRLTCDSAATCAFDIQAGDDSANIAPTFLSICGGNYPTLTSDTYMVDNTLTGWLPLLATRTLLRLVPLANAGVTAANPVTLLLTLERR